MLQWISQDRGDSQIALRPGAVLIIPGVRGRSTPAAWLAEAAISVLSTDAVRSTQPMSARSRKTALSDLNPLTVDAIPKDAPRADLDWSWSVTPVVSRYQDRKRSGLKSGIGL